MYVQAALWLCMCRLLSDYVCAGCYLIMYVHFVQAAIWLCMCRLLFDYRCRLLCDYVQAAVGLNASCFLIMHNCTWNTGCCLIMCRHESVFVKADLVKAAVWLCADLNLFLYSLGHESWPVMSKKVNNLYIGGGVLAFSITSRRLVGMNLTRDSSFSVKK